MKIVPKIISLLMVVVVLSMSVFGCTQKTSTVVQKTSEDNKGKLVVKVVDKSTKKPVNDAKVTIVGVDSVYKTDDKGLSPEIKLEVNKDFYKKYGEALSQKAPSGSATILVSKDGYKDYVIVNKAVFPGYASNNINIELPKLLKSDKQKYIVDVEYPHDTWIEELVQYCKVIKEPKEGSGDNKVAINVKDKNSKAVDGVSLVIPELGIKGVTDKSGKIILKPGAGSAGIDSVTKDSYCEYTIVALKEGYKPEIILSTAVYNNKDSNVNVVLKPDSDKGQGNFAVSHQTIDKAWIEKLIETHKKTGTE